ncbi:MAG: AbrB/MazE/SpoVT family DNA-binding domain-containing protein [Thermodesulfobacteriota bacterium]
MSRVTSKGQITIPQNIREKFGFVPGAEVEVIVQDGRVVVVKSRHENPFMKWLGRGKRRNKRRVDTMIDQIRGRTDE